MKTTNQETIDVTFRKYNNGNIIALFLHDVDTFEGGVMSYMHIGQHGSATYDLIINSTKPAKPDEYEDLKCELESIGYVLNIVKKQNYDKYLKSYYNVRKI